MTEASIARTRQGRQPPSSASAGSGAPSENAEEWCLDRRIAQRIRARRVTLGLTQQQLALSLGVSYQQIQKYETGTNRIAAARLARLAQKLDVPVEYFLGEAAGAVSPESLMGEMAESQPSRVTVELAQRLVEIGDSDVRLAVAALVRAVIERKAR